MSEHEPQTDDQKFTAWPTIIAELGVGSETVPEPARTESEILESVVSRVQQVRAQVHGEIGATLGVETTGGVNVSSTGGSPAWELALTDAASGARLDDGRVVEH